MPVPVGPGMCRGPLVLFFPFLVTAAVFLMRGEQQRQGTCGLVAMTSASHAEGRHFDPGQVYFAAAQSSKKSATA